jgi:hypothetical protein
MPKAGAAGLRCSHDVDEQTRPFTNTRQAVQMRDEFICSAVIAIVAIDSLAVPGTAQAMQAQVDVACVPRERHAIGFRFDLASGNGA